MATPLLLPSNNLINEPNLAKSTPDIVSIEVLNENKKMLEFSTHPIGIRCVMNNNFSLLHGGKLQLIITDASNHQCTLEITGLTKNKILQLITQ